MGLFSKLKKQLSVVIEWKEQNQAILFYKYQAPTDEIKNASKLIVSPGQGCILVYEGKVQDVITDQGTFFISSDNHPFFTTFLKLRQAFESEHKMHLYFFRQADVLNIHWGTASPIKYLEPTYNFPIELGAFGNFSLRITQPQLMIETIVAMKAQYSVAELKEVVIARITPLISSMFAKAKYSYRDIDSHLADISNDTKHLVNSEFESLGVELTDFRVEGTNFDEATLTRIGKIADMTTEALSAAEAGLDYVQLEKLRALRDAARNEGGLAGAGLQMGAGWELSKSLLNDKANAQTQQVINQSEANDDPMIRLKKLKMLLDEDIITKEEFDEKKKDLLDKI